MGEGGGQVLRTSLTLACLTGTAVEVFNIRARRPKPGLRPQHLLSARAASEITGGRLRGAGLGSTRLVFEPGYIKPGSYLFDVAKDASSAGSAGLVFQTVTLPLAYSGGPSRVEIRGGTHVKWSPPADYITEVYLPALAKMGAEAEAEVHKYGFYPVGGGEIEVEVSPLRHPLAPVDFTERGPLRRAFVRSGVSNLPLSIAERQLYRASERLKTLGLETEGECIEAKGPGRGTFLFILLEFENTTAGFTSLGERGKKAERVAEDAAGEAAAYLTRSGALDPHLADQLVMPMALAEGESSFTTTEVTGHLATNMKVIEEFLPVEFGLEGAPGGEGSLAVKGSGLKPMRI